MKNKKAIYNVASQQLISSLEKTTWEIIPFSVGTTTNYQPHTYVVGCHRHSASWAKPRFQAVSTSTLGTQVHRPTWQAPSARSSSHKTGVPMNEWVTKFFANFN